MIPQDYFKAGKIAKQVKNDAMKRLSIGDTVLEVCERVEDMIRRLGGEVAFPCNVGINSITAHYTAEIGDEVAIKDDDVVKVDLGIHVNGYIADTAFTVSFNSAYEGLVRATEAVLKEGISMVRKDVRTGDIGRVISSAANKRGFRPITNLSGHSLQQYQIHGGLSIPNVWVAHTPPLRADGVYAIEPFLTTNDGAGYVIEDERKRIFALVGRRRLGDKRLDDFVDEVWRRHRTLPFTPRWFSSTMDRREVEDIIDVLVKRRVLKAYPVLIEASGRRVAQFEDTVMLTEGGAVSLIQ